MPFGFNGDKSRFDLDEIQAEIDNITGIGTELRATDDLNDLITPNTRYHWRGGDEYPANTPSNMDMEEGEAYRLEVMEDAAEGYIEQRITCGPRTLMRYYNTSTQQWFNWRRNLTDADTAVLPYAAGDTITGIYYGAGYVTGSGKYFAFEIPLSKPVDGNVSINTIAATVRQGGNYIYGSGSGAQNVKSIAHVAKVTGGLRITLEPSSAPSGVVNNDVFGVVCNYSIKVS